MSYHGKKIPRIYFLKSKNQARKKMEARRDIGFLRLHGDLLWVFAGGILVLLLNSNVGLDCGG